MFTEYVESFASCDINCLKNINSLQEKIALKKFNNLLEIQ